ncbi:hypothetical protein STRAU_1619 [Streptomyces aurantiacus JA 4570]|uniref:Uncharacterized protein n=1 Tax=Streptomyces aurantiacus JA 4570 TaxID=1286094 RepID=S3ZRB0_9ACTN|nr:hypothetical protein STRAU_1619 [Streptomyces aurantiacus JA 4570]
MPAPTCVPPACADLTALPRLFSPLIAELMGAFCHTRRLAALAQDEQCTAEYQMAARSVIHHVLEGWQHQTGGHGTIDDLLLQPRRTRPAGGPPVHAADSPVAREHRIAS